MVHIQQISVYEWRGDSVGFCSAEGTVDGTFHALASTGKNPIDVVKDYFVSLIIIINNL